MTEQSAMAEEAAMTEKRTAAGTQEPEAAAEETTRPGGEPLTEEKKTGEKAETADTEKVSDAEDEMLCIDPVEDALNASETIRDMSVGLASAAAVLAAAGCVFVREGWYRWVLGVLLGAAAAGLMLRHLYVTIDRALDMDEEHATKYMKKSATLRILMAGAALAAGALLPELFHVFGVFAGVLCLKFSAYLQPLTHKVIKFFSKGG